MEGRINFTGSETQDGKRPCFKGFLTIGDEVHEFAVWPAKSGNGWSGTYKPKGEKGAYKKPEQSTHNESKANAYQPQPASALLDDDILGSSIPF